MTGLEDTIIKIVIVFVVVVTFLEYFVDNP